LDKRLYLPSQHVVWLDNLFSNIRLFERLRAKGIGAIGTFWLIKTKRKELDNKKKDKKKG